MPSGWTSRPAEDTAPCGAARTSDGAILVAGVSGYMKKICAKIGLEPLQLTAQVIELIETKQLGRSCMAGPGLRKRRSRNNNGESTVR